MTDATTPVGETPHGAMPRGLETTPTSRVFGGRFGRMFRNLPSYDVADESLVVPGLSMSQWLEDDEALDKPLGVEDENTAQLADGTLRLAAAGVTTVIPGARSPEKAAANAAAGSAPALAPELLAGVRRLYDTHLRTNVHGRW